MTALRLVRVVWEDASVVDDNGPWVDKATAPPAKAVHFDQVGWLVELTPSHVVLVSAIGEELMSQRDRIPIGMVKSITEFKAEDGKPVRIPKPRKKAQ